MSYQIYKEMKARFRLSVWKDEDDGVKKPGYKSEVYRIHQIIGNEELMKKKRYYHSGRSSYYEAWSYGSISVVRNGRIGKHLITL